MEARPYRGDDYFRSVDLAKLLRGAEGLAKFPASARASPESLISIGFEAISNLSHLTNSGRQGPENWWFSPENQPMDCGLYLVRDSIILPGGFSSPDYSAGHFFQGRRLGFHQGTGCLLLSDGSLFDGSFAIQDNHRNLPKSRFTFDGEFHSTEELPNPPTRPGLYYFLGNLIPHWGHFLLDGMSRLWALLKMPPSIRKRLTFVCLDNRMPPWAWSLLEPFGIRPENVLFAKEPMRLEQMFVPMESYQTHVNAHPIFQSVFDAVSHRYTTPPSRMVYLSRRRQASRSLENEAELEEFMSGLGFEVVVPELLTVPDQVELARSASVLAGGTGSNMYLALFQRPHSRTLVFAPQNFLLKDDYLLACIGRRHAGFVLGEPHVTSGPWKSRWRLSLSSKVKEYVEQFSLSSSPAAPKMSSAEPA
jgi:hypothetical protein